jgi:hypothetical protein
MSIDDDHELAARNASLAKDHARIRGGDPDEAAREAYDFTMRSKGYKPVTRNLSGHTLSEQERGFVGDEINDRLSRARSHAYQNGEKYFFEDLERKKIQRDVETKRGIYTAWE